jgi:hypothetical protein
VLEIEVRGERHLPSNMDPERLVAATEYLGEQLGVDGHLILRINRRRCKKYALLETHDRTHFTIDLFDRVIRSGARSEVRRPYYTIAAARFVSIMYMATLAHEMVHISQVQRGSRGLLVSVADEEAEALEDVFGPLAWRVLMDED